MPVAEIFLAAFVTVLFERLATREFLKLACHEGISDKLKKWERDLKTIDAFLSDAEEKQVTDSSVKFWLRELRDLAYDIEDVLDELAYEVFRRGLKPAVEHGSSSSTSKVRKFLPACCLSLTITAIAFDHRISSKINKISSRLDELSKGRSDLMLIQNLKENPVDMEEVSRTTTSLVEPSRILGREKDKVEILKLFPEDTAINRTGEVHVIPIVGMAGVGKTSLAQLVYNDEQVKGRFTLTAWISVREKFDLLGMTCAIYRSVARDSKEFKDLDSVQVSLKEKLLNKKFLIVLDDVWNRNYERWVLFQAPFLVGAPGSTIIVTTRNDDVTQVMGSVKAHRLQPLSDTDCLAVIAQHALGREDFAMRPDLKEVGEKIAKRCKGLPLSAKALGGILRTKVSLEQWNDLLSSKVWDLSDTDIIPALRLSYHQLPSHLKPLFSYCSIFPKDYLFDIQELILLWMAEGFLKQSGNKPMEKLGLEYFDELKSRSFFQNSEHIDSRYVMHDSMNELAEFIAGERCCRLDDGMAREVFEKSRHLSIRCHDHDSTMKFKAFDGVRSLRTFLALSFHPYLYLESYSNSNALTNLISQSRYLRVLSLSGFQNITEVPDSIGGLKQLRYLNFSGTAITQLPESVCELYNLQTLLLRFCQKLTQLPKNIRNLSNLRHLDIANTHSLRRMPFGLGMLTSLRTLPRIQIDDDGLKLSELKGLNYLQGSLFIHGMQNVKNVQDAAAADLSRKHGITELAITWVNCFDEVSGQQTSDGFQGKETDTEVLEVLKPQKALENLQIESYGGNDFPSWVGDPSFSSMVHLNLINCKNCTLLPSLGQLPSLRSLFIKGMDRVEDISANFFGESAFPSLETLRLHHMDKWEGWSANSVNGAKNVKGVFPRLTYLEICYCPKLLNVSLPQIPSLIKLEVTGCTEVVLRTMISLGSVKTLEIRDISGLSQLDEGVIQFLGALEDLKVLFCGEMRYIWQDEVACQGLKLLKSLSVVACEQLVSFGEKEHVLPYNLESLELHFCANLEQMPNSCESLKRLHIEQCNKLQYFPYSPLKIEVSQAIGDKAQSSRCNRTEGFPNLDDLKVLKCSGLMSLPTGKKLPTSLKSLHISDCVNLGETEEGDEEDLFSSLESIFICNWKDLKSLPNAWLFSFVHVTKMEINKCQGIKSFPERCFPTRMRDLTISRCENIRYLCNDDRMMQSLTSLQNLTVKWCKNLESFPSVFWPPNVKSIVIGGLKKPITEWGLHGLPTSLLTLSFVGEIPDLVSFSQVETQLCTTSLTSLVLWNLVNLESLSVGLQNLTSLKQLTINKCPMLRSLPEMLLSNLSSLEICQCPHLEEKCRKEQGDYWPSISNIPEVHMYSFMSE